MMRWDTSWRSSAVLLRLLSQCARRRTYFYLTTPMYVFLDVYRTASRNLFSSLAAKIIFTTEYSTTCYAILHRRMRKAVSRYRSPDTSSKLKDPVTLKHNSLKHQQFKFLLVPSLCFSVENTKILSLAGPWWSAISYLPVVAGTPLMIGSSLHPLNMSA